MYPITIHVKEEDLAGWHRVASLYYTEGSSILDRLESQQEATLIVTDKGLEKVPSLYEQITTHCTCGSCWGGLARSDRVQWNPLRKHTGTIGWVNSKHGKYCVPTSCALFTEKLISGYIYEPTPSKKELTNLNRARTEQALKEIELQEKRDNYEQERRVKDLARAKEQDKIARQSKSEEEKSMKLKASETIVKEKKEKVIEQRKSEQAKDREMKIKRQKLDKDLTDVNKRLDKAGARYLIKGDARCPNHGVIHKFETYPSPVTLELALKRETDSCHKAVCKGIFCKAKIDVTIDKPKELWGEACFGIGHDPYKDARQKLERNQLIEQLQSERNKVLSESRKLAALGYK